MIQQICRAIELSYTRNLLEDSVKRVRKRQWIDWFQIPVFIGINGDLAVRVHWPPGRWWYWRTTSLVSCWGCNTNQYRSYGIGEYTICAVLDYVVSRRGPSQYHINWNKENSFKKSSYYFIWNLGYNKLCMLSELVLTWLFPQTFSPFWLRPQQIEVQFCASRYGASCLSHWKRYGKHQSFLLWWTWN